MLSLAWTRSVEQHDNIGVYQLQPKPGSATFCVYNELTRSFVRHFVSIWEIYYNKKDERTGGRQLGVED